MYDAGEADGVLYLSMRYVEGTDLERLLEVEGYLSPEIALSIVAQCAAALDAAHAEGLVHRGVVPAAILLERGWMDGGRAFLADFGITKHVAASTRMTRTGSFAGTVDYVAPEEIRGDDDVDGRADVYSLGCVLYRCLTGEVPFPRDSELVTIYAHLEDPPPRPSDARSDLPTAMDGVIARALAKSREQRYATCMDLARAAADAIGATSPASAHEAHEPPPPPPKAPASPGVTPERSADPSVRRGRRRRPPPRGARSDVGWFRQPGASTAVPATSVRPRPGRPSSRQPVRSRARPHLPRKTPTIAGTTKPRDSSVPGDLNAVLALGDNQYETGSYQDYATYYDPWWGQSRSITEPVPGDREYNQGASPLPTGYFEYFGERVMGPDGLGFRSFNLPAGCTYHDPLCWHFIALNSELCLTSGGCGPPAAGVTAGPGNTMYRWLKRDLATYPNAKYPMHAGVLASPAVLVLDGDPADARGAATVGPALRRARGRRAERERAQLSTVGTDERARAGGSEARDPRVHRRDGGREEGQLGNRHLAESDSPRRRTRRSACSR